jgi:hypothetical protein
MTEWLRLIRSTSWAIVARSARLRRVLLAHLLLVGSKDGLDEFLAVQICGVGPSRWMSTRRPSRCLPQLICCQATQMIPFVLTRREIQPSSDRSTMAVNAGRNL